MTRETLHLSCSADEAYAPHSAATIHSALVNREDLDIHIYYQHGPYFPERIQRLISEMVDHHGASITFLPVPDARVQGLAVPGYFSKANWYRIFLPELLPELDRILYLDVDAIVTDSLVPLWRTDLGDHWLGAVTNVFDHQQRDRPRDLGLQTPELYFNSGVLLMNLEQMRRDACSEAVQSYALSQGSRMLWVDQDALSVVLGERRLRLHPRWNCMNSIMCFPWSAEVHGAEAVAKARRNPAIRHFEGPSINKPWHYLCDRPMRHVYFAHRQATPWPHCRLEGATVGNRVRRIVRMLKSKRSRSAAEAGGSVGS